MVRKFKINVRRFVNIHLIPALRKNIRLEMYAQLLSPFTMINDEWVTYRNKSTTRAKVNGESISLEWYLNYLFDTDLQRIYIDTNDLDGVQFGISATEPDDYQELGIQATEPAAKVAFPFYGESSDIGRYSFGVFIPAALSSSEDDIKDVVNNYRIAGKTFTIIQF